MRLLTVRESVVQQGQTEPVRPQPQADPAGVTSTFVGGKTSGIGDWSAVEKMRADTQASLPLDQKLSMIIQQTKTAQTFAAQALRSTEAFERRLDEVFKKLSGMIQQSKSGQPPAQETPGESIWDEEGDSESIFGK